ncbi:MAG: inositol monophosphatase family protein [Candidatus Micrarchaeota archaeon]
MWICMLRELEVAINAVKAAGRISLDHFGEKIPFQMKADGSPVTSSDKCCDAAILGIIRRNFPDDSVLSEESAELRNDLRRRWIIDPIDGTKAFLRGLPTYGNMVAFEQDGKIVAGAINIPAMGILMHAEVGKGAFVNGKRVHASSETRLSNAYILHGRGKGFLEKGYLKKLRKLLNAAYHSWGMSEPFAHYLVATGKADAFVETFPKPWDVAAAKIIISEAGGKFSDLSGKDTLCSDTIAIYSNNRLHPSLMKILRK